MSLAAFDDIIAGPLTQWMALSKAIGADVSVQANLVHQGFSVERDFLDLASRSSKPDQNTLMKLLQPISDAISAIQGFREKNRGSKQFNHLSTISESIPALGWVAVVSSREYLVHQGFSVERDFLDLASRSSKPDQNTLMKLLQPISDAISSPTPAPYVKEMNDAGQFYSNRVLKEFKDSDKRHVDWVWAWTSTLTELQGFVKQWHTTGVVWNPRGAPATASGAPSGGEGREAYRRGKRGIPKREEGNAEGEWNGGLSKGEGQLVSSIYGLTASLYEFAFHCRLYVWVFLGLDAWFRPRGHRPPSGPRRRRFKFRGGEVARPPKLELEGKKWCVEYFNGNRNLLIGETEMQQRVYMYKCVDSTLQVRGKVNSITMDSCKKAAILFENAIGQFELINCQSCQLQVTGKCPVITIDKCDGIQMFLSEASKDVEIISSKSSEMNVLVPKPDGEFVEYPVPEQFRTIITPKGLYTTVTESTGV
ncbi:unnamed protein product [Cyprideis torosa]|uniref:Uncharacterized protein n=1 Tax=Cyprideis torosa TaxID=163714 RepID=A0A7R8WE75_9CRUS|nr:unnamed protein product [Cyprideis torosa]CAG0890379.1 unnamed protein product [Cyprideis torosa]